MFGFAYTVKADADILAGLHCLGNLKENNVHVFDGGPLRIPHAGKLFKHETLPLINGDLASPVDNLQ